MTAACYSIFLGRCWQASTQKPFSINRFVVSGVKGRILVFQQNARSCISFCHEASLVMDVDVGTWRSYPI